jgi:hypothetical protein
VLIVDTVFIDESKFNAIRHLGLPERTEPNKYLLYYVYGDGVRVSPKWNAKVYTNKKGQLKVVTNDYDTLDNLLNHNPPPDTNGKKVIQIDDAGWGFPLGGVMIGAVYGDKIVTGIIDLKFFQNDFLYDRKEYLDESARVAVRLVSELGGNPDDTVIEICTGEINTRSKDALRALGYPVIVTEITGTLQDNLERLFREYAYSLGYNLYYDPKATNNVARDFESVIKWIRDDYPARMKLAKTSWKYFKDKGMVV